METSKLLDGVEKIKGDLSNSLMVWVDGRIDDFVKGKPVLSVVGSHLKRRLENEMIFNSDKMSKYLNEATMWVMDKDGTVKADLLVDDLISILKSMENTPFNYGFLKGTIGEGGINITLPKSPITSFIFGETEAIKINENDLLELKGLLKNKVWNTKI
ncbi:hypothetical protein KUBF_29950 [Bacteroides finegoldii]|nr:hypothetical protein KUBF_29950 [Bacteroides finegoldii]DAJ84885.1 MAG TPA: pyrophosphatase pyrophosphatase [Caudoviricetes sp.]